MIEQLSLTVGALLLFGFVGLSQQESHFASYVSVQGWTEWFDRDNPPGNGDWEDLASLRKENPGKICQKPINIEAMTLLGLSVEETGEKIHKYDTTSGFVCRNEDQRNHKCHDYKVRFRCPVDTYQHSIDTYQPSIDTYQHGGWTEWFDRDDPPGSGDWEDLASLRKENPGKICLNPTNIEARTLFGLNVEQTGEKIHRYDTTFGFVCRNKDQRDHKCHDYKVRFRCPIDTYQPSIDTYQPSIDTYQPSIDTFQHGGWTQWFDRDDPPGSGDWEDLASLHKENPGKICLNPTNIEARTLFGLSVEQTGEKIHRYDTTSGFVCRNEDQRNHKCHDYKVRFRCTIDTFQPSINIYQHVCWTKWYNRDCPTGSGDWEDLSSLLKRNPDGNLCAKPVKIEAVTVDKEVPALRTGQKFHFYSPEKGFVCRNRDQIFGKCRDYKVRFGCYCHSIA